MARSGCPSAGLGLGSCRSLSAAARLCHLSRRTEQLLSRMGVAVLHPPGSASPPSEPGRAEVVIFLSDLAL